MKISTFHFINDWRQLFQLGRCNWYDFTFIHLYFEIEEISRTAELECILLGLGFNIRFNIDYKHSEIKRIADEAYAELKADNCIPGGFGGDCEYSDELQSTLSALADMVKAGITEREQSKIAGYIHEAMAAIEVDKYPDEEPA